MIVVCPECSARFRLDENRRRSGKRLTLKCARCQKTFRVEIAADEEPLNRDAFKIKVFVAHSDPQMCSMIQEILLDAGIVCRVCSEGKLALDLMEKDPPHVALMDVALPGLYAFEAVEKIKQRSGLAKVKILLLSSVYNKTAYKRTPASLYGADDYIEKHHLSSDLVFKIENLVSAKALTPLGAEGQSVQGNSGCAGDADFPNELTDQINSKIHSLENQGLAGGSLEKAKRLARIIVSDIALYNQKKVDDGIRTGKFFELLAPEIEEGRRLFADRFQGQESRAQDFLHQAFSALIETRKKELQI